MSWKILLAFFSVLGRKTNVKLMAFLNVNNSRSTLSRVFSRMHVEVGDILKITREGSRGNDSGSVQNSF